MDVRLKRLREKLDGIRACGSEDGATCFDYIFADTLARLIDVDQETQQLRDERERVLGAVLHLCMTKLGIADQELTDILEQNGPELLRLFRNADAKMN